MEIVLLHKRSSVREQYSYRKMYEMKALVDAYHANTKITRNSRVTNKKAVKHCTIIRVTKAHTHITELTLMAAIANVIYALG